MAEKPLSDDIISEVTKKVLSYFRSKEKNKRENPFKEQRRMGPIDGR